MTLDRYVEFTCRNSFRILRKVTVLFCIVVGVCHAQDCGNGNIRQVREASLRRAGMVVLNAIKQKNTDGLLSYVGRHGVGFGPDKTRLSRNDLRSQFTRKEGAYCLFFSTACIPYMGRFKGLEPDSILSEWKISYIDWLGISKTYATYADLTDDAGSSGCSGYFSASAQAKMKNAPDNIELDFSFENGRWWLVDTVASAP